MFDDKVIPFEEATVENVSQFDARNLGQCKYLNIRNSSFDKTDAKLLYKLELIDISNSKI